MNELLQALDITIVEELLLEVRLSRAGFRSGTLRRRHRDIASARHLELAVYAGRILCPIRIRVGGRSRAASEKSANSQISVPEAEGIRYKSIGSRRSLVVESISRIQW